MQSNTCLDKFFHFKKAAKRQKVRGPASNDWKYKRENLRTLKSLRSAKNSCRKTMVVEELDNFHCFVNMLEPRNIELEVVTDK